MMKKLKAVVFVLEDLTALEMAADHVLVLSMTDIQDNIVKAAGNSIFSGKTSSDTIVVLDRIQNIAKKRANALEELPIAFDRIKTNDITMIMLKFEGGASDTYYMFHGDVGYKTNDYQRAEDVCGYLLIGVGKERGSFGKTMNRINKAVDKEGRYRGE